MSLDKEVIHKELDLIQGVITRMAANSFEVKKWLIGILTAIVVFKHDEMLGGNAQLIWILLIPVFCFWYLDAFFLSTEKLYREMYRWTVKYRSQTDKYLYDLNTMQREFPAGHTEDLIKKKNNPWHVARTRTIWPFYIVPTIFIIAYGLVKWFSHCHG